VKPWIIGNGNPLLRCAFAYGKNTVSIIVHITGCSKRKKDNKPFINETHLKLKKLFTIEFNNYSSTA
jgi:hypothetical protein